MLYDGLQEDLNDLGTREGLLYVYGWDADELTQKHLAFQVLYRDRKRTNHSCEYYVAV